MTFHAPPQRITPRQDRKPKLFCADCKKSRRMYPAPGGYLCRCGKFRPEARRTISGPVDNKKAETR